jgi:hypothetical protein
VSTKEEMSSKSPKSFLSFWDEAGSKGLDTWFELPAAYDTTDGCAEPVGTYEHLSPMDHDVVSSGSEERWCEGYYARLKHQLAR